MYIRLNRSHPMSYDGCSHLTEGWGLLILGYKYNTFGLGVFFLSSHFSSVVNNLKCRYSFSMYIYIYIYIKYANIKSEPPMIHKRTFGRDYSARIQCPGRTGRRRPQQDEPRSRSIPGFVALFVFLRGDGDNMGERRGSTRIDMRRELDLDERRAW